MGFLLSLPIASALALKCRKALAETIPPACMLMIFVLYCAGFTGNFIPGIRGIAALSLCCLFYCLWHRIRKGAVLNRADYPVLCLYFFLMLFFMAADYGRSVQRSDEFGHWALAVKNYYLYNRYSNLPPAVDPNWNYPPFTTIWEYFCTRLWLGYSEGISYLGYQMLMISFLLPGLVSQNEGGMQSAAGKAGSDPRDGRTGEPLRDRRGGATAEKTIAFGVCALLLPVMTYRGAYTSLLPDAFSGILAAYILWMLQRGGQQPSGRFYEVSAAAGMASLVLAKNNGVVLAAAIVLVYLLKRAFEDAGAGKGCRSFCRSAALYPAAVAGGYFSWELYLTISALEEGWQAKAWVFVLLAAGGTAAALLLVWAAAVIGVKRRWTLTLSWRLLWAAALLAAAYILALRWRISAGGLNPAYGGRVAGMFLRHLFLTERCSIGMLLPVSFGHFVILLNLGILGYSAVVRRKTYSGVQSEIVPDGSVGHSAAACPGDIQDDAIRHSPVRHDGLRLLLAGDAVAGLYCLVLLAMYVLRIGPANDMSIYLPSFQRYLAPCALMLLLLGLSFVLENFAFGKKGYLVLAAVVCLCSDPGELAGMVMEKSPEVVYWAIPHSGIQIGPEDRFYLIDQDWDNVDQSRQFQYYVAPGTGVFEEAGSLYLGAEPGETPDTGRPATAEELRDSILSSGCNYVYINELDDVDRVRRIYGELFEDPSVIDDCTLYAVHADGDSLSLSLIGQ